MAMSHLASPPRSHDELGIRRASASSSIIGGGTRTSLSPVVATGRLENGHTAPAPSSRMALSALVNSPLVNSPPAHHTSLSPTMHHAHAHSRSPPRAPSLPQYPPAPPTYDRYADPYAARYARDTREYAREYEVPAVYSSSRSAWANGNGDTYHSRSERGESSRRVRQVVLPSSLIGGEDVWEAPLREYQAKREQECTEIALLAAEEVLAPRRSVPLPSAADEDTKPSRKPRPSEAKENKKRPAKKRKGKEKAAAIDDELLGLAEGEEAASQPARSSPQLDIGSDVAESDHEAPIDLSPDAIVQPCGLTRAEVIARVEANDMEGLTETDVKAVQDEMWARKKDAAGGAPVRKDGSVRKKPGPAKGWKKLRGEPIGRRPSSVRGDDSDAGDTSIAGDTVNGEAEADIAALLTEDAPAKKKSKSKKRKVELDDDASRYDEASEDGHLDMTADDLALSLLEDGTPGGNKKKPKHKEPGVGKGKWTRPVGKDGKDGKKADAAALHNALMESFDDIGMPTTPTLEQHPDPLAAYGGPNMDDPRGVSEAEARVRLGLVEDLQKVAWASIVRDIPRMYRVNQAYDTAIKINSARRAQAAVRNGASSKVAKTRAARIARESVFKAKRVIKELLVYWRKNEKEELTQRKKAEKEAMERAKAEEEAREAKRQSRKLNFLLTQTELYSHFIGKKIKTKEAEGIDGEMDMGDDKEKEIQANEDLGLDPNGEPLPDIDYDDDDEENLRRHAARGAQAAVQAAKDKANAFDSQRKQETLDLDGDELNFQNPTLAEGAVTIEQPKLLMAQLKEYQLKGLTWLGNLYEQGINGILADEMGLGKTIQSIALLAYLAEHHNLWGPFLVIAPASTLHNWQQELARFVPRLKALPYWGAPKDREVLRRVWTRKNQTYAEDSPFHVVVTSYEMAVVDEKHFKSVRWQYMILDEAQAIKSSQSNRWKSLLSLQCRNRLLLTGTPIQNSMQELWALLHFIMPSLFDSHEEFSEWFSKDIENAAGGNTGSLKPEQLRRLHMILKPFMLRRVKKHVQKELGDKIEIDLLVNLSQRQRAIYKALRTRVSISDLIAQANNATDSLGAKNLMNLVMQFRKVCNHPDIFERAEVVSPFMFGSFSQSGPLSRQGDQLYCPDSAKNAIEVKLPKILWTDGGKLDRPSEDRLGSADGGVLGNLMNIWNAGHVSRAVKEDGSEYGFLKVLGVAPGQLERRAKAHPLVKLVEDNERSQQWAENGEDENDHSLAASTAHPFHLVPSRVPDIRVTPSAPALRDITNTAWNTSFLSRPDARFAVEAAIAPAIKPFINDRSYYNSVTRLSTDPIVQKALYGVTPSEADDLRACEQFDRLVPHVGPRGILGNSTPDQAPLAGMRVPPTKRLIVDSAKLARLDDLLRELKDGGHRVLLYFQMTKMMDLVEEYLIYRQYKYLRLDGSSPIGERRDMVTSWQTNPDIFVFCLSTRAGGLGINLTAADTVIFYDHDWNPSNDAQAMDRAHRVGQTKQVTVYRLIARGTIEERILKLARAKKDVQDIVVGTKSLTDVAKPSEIASLFMDDEELAGSVAKRKQAEAHGYVAPSLAQPKGNKTFGDGLGGNDDDEDDFFSLKRKVPNAEEEDYGDEQEGGSGRATPKDAKKKKAPSKRKAPSGEEGGPKKPSKKVKLALGPDGLPMA